MSKKRQEEFGQKIKRSLNNMEAKTGFLHEGVKGLNDAFKDFREDIGDFMSYTAESYSDHEKRISDSEKKLLR